MSRRSWMPRSDPGLSLRRGQLLELGVTRSRLASHDVERVFHGAVLLPGTGYDASSMRERCLAFAPLMRPGWFFTGRSAAALWGIPVSSGPAGTIEVGAVYPARQSKRAGVLGHQVPAGLLHLERRYGLPVPSVEDLWCLLATQESFRGLVAIGDFLISGPVARPRRPLTSAEHLSFAELRHRGTRGAVARRRALALLRAGVDSRPETYMRLATLDAGLPEPVVSCPVMVRGRRGPLELHADNGYPDWKIAGEYEGGVHFGDVHRAKRDVERWELMADAGWRVVRATSRDFPDFRDYTARLGRLLVERGGGR